ncbi:hypothetical protein [Demequina gelatinilytica]|uniref:hypothetical protein n=1 Tax=Demequina gelatinilytica TaxID=1638980 RepID=UPI0007816A7E|nr:hypothetical protein [Demequina gelatinilytica]
MIAAALCRADLRALRAGGVQTGSPAQADVLVLREPTLAAALDRQDSLAAGSRVDPGPVAALRARWRARRLSAAAAPAARIVRPGAGRLGEAVDAAVAEPRPLASAELHMLATIDAALAGTATPAAVRASVVRDAVLNALYSSAAAEAPEDGLPAGAAHAVVAGAVSALLGHGLAFAGPDTEPLVRAPGDGIAVVADPTTMSTRALLRMLAPAGGKP